MLWNKIYKTYGVVQSAVLPICKKLIGMLPQKKQLKILDLGSGTGQQTIYFAKNKHWKIFAFDSSREALKYIKYKIQKNNFTNIQTTWGVFDKLPYANNQFDVIISTRTIHHATTKTIKRCALEMNRVLKNNGLIILVVLSRKDFRFTTGTFQGDVYTKVNCVELIDPEMPHHFFSLEELKVYFPNYQIQYSRISTRESIKGLAKVTYLNCLLKKIRME